ncbi:hypothetical protein LEP1GSC034_2543 [Leptospira interrogans str. 2003000735]|uniref:Uncharacterized protein n=5 Tax=Leptospira interrogans TaxID=173 RepID=A0A0E2D695_LEPIR|nr:hypothetical protein BRAT_12675 [Leptospira interrogans serovar Bratislava]ALE40148.1 hypothetical protein G436_2983 [Leptospira interrogans serovar Hardjo str. Norma]ALO01166.1 hypothetical protein LIH_12455 [Leptospira interrogans serovar Hardjo-prajitno]EJO80746.1 hypothetical protein LEP1GSC045_1660 [Leptospira interrogans serovar Pomona str. Kennewicki LC82-25]EJP02894.1 hypothetical protein LEP1GSC007_2627 [Leptospira interrogans serovar Bulgarica str. Mallika]EJP18055.1 hypothetical 
MNLEKRVKVKRLSVYFFLLNFRIRILRLRIFQKIKSFEIQSRF